MSGSEVVNLQIKDIINEIRPVVINKKRTELDARHDIGRENKVTEIMELISTKNIDLMEYLESMLYRVIQHALQRKIFIRFVCSFEITHLLTKKQAQKNVDSLGAACVSLCLLFC